MASIKNFFKKKKEEAKFKMQLGPGRKLNSSEPAPSSSKPKKDQEAYVPPKRKNNDLSAEAKAAAAAALARINQPSSKEFNTSIAAIKAQVRRELDAEKKAKEELKTQQTTEKKSNPEPISTANLAVQGVYFRCPMISEEILSKKEWRVKIKKFLYEQLTEEPGLTACLIIVNCNVKDKAEACIETLRKYLENIVNNPNEEKYHKIRLSNRIYTEKVQNIEGSFEFLQAAGFKEETIDDDQFLRWSKENVDNIDQLNILLDGLSCAETLNLELDRNIQVLLPSQARRVELPSDFYRISPEEIKKEQELRLNAIEAAQVLKTKAMRERDELRTVNRYRYALIRVRLPNGLYLQGTFNVYEKLTEIYDFVQSCLKDEVGEFSLIAPAGVRFSRDDMEKTLHDLRLVPNTIFNFESEDGKKDETEYIKQELLMLIQQM